MNKLNHSNVSVTVGIHFQADTHQLRNTLQSITNNNHTEIDIILLSDGVGIIPQGVIQNDTVKISSSVDVQGAAACFNRLCTMTQTDVVVFLESGCQVAPGWLDYLLEAILAEPHHGLAGPSTNSAWNEQCVYPGLDSDPVDIENISKDLIKQYGKTWQSLEPLYSLADFCYVVHRDVIKAVGAADESYGVGPCWEMDYNIRAERAGYKGVWARSAYVYRAPFNSQRTMHESAFYERSKQRYQRKFCARQQQSGSSTYRNHCRGDDCPNFACVEKIQINIPQTVIEQSADSYSVSTVLNNYPLVTCIMPTADRRTFIPQAVQCFLNQDYPNLELLVVDDGKELIQDCLPEDDWIRYIRLETKSKLGIKRNLACAEAQGEIIFHWDDDDWYPPNRVSSQVAAMLKNNADVCGSSRLYYYEQHCERAWEYQYSNRNWVAGNTLAYRREFWRNHQFADVHIGEDNMFIRQVNAKSLVDLRNPSLCFATIHPNNTSRKKTNGSLWLPLSYKKLRNIQQQEVSAVSQKLIPFKPRVSCILPTYNRRQFIPLTLDNFFAQSYPNKELIIIDDSNEPIADLVKGLSNVKLVPLAQRTSIGKKRNMACDHATGEIVAHWDDDDWYGPDRLQRQVQPILDNYADITGLESRYVLNLVSGEFWSMDARLHRRMFVGNVHGGTLVFRKSIWDAGAHYPEINLAEDAAFLKTALQQGAKLTRIANSGCFVYMRHGNNAWKFDSGRFLDPCGWKRTKAPSEFNPTIQSRYQNAAKLYQVCNSTEK